MSGRKNIDFEVILEETELPFSRKGSMARLGTRMYTELLDRYREEYDELLQRLQETLRRHVWQFSANEKALQAFLLCNRRLKLLRGCRDVLYMICDLVLAADHEAELMRGRKAEFKCFFGCSDGRFMSVACAEFIAEKMEKEPMAGFANLKCVIKHDADENLLAKPKRAGGMGKGKGKKGHDQRRRGKVANEYFE